MEDQTQNYQNTGYGDARAQSNPQIESLKSLVNMAGIISLVFGILLIILGIFTLVTLIFGIIDILIWYFCREINRLIDEGKYTEARSKTMLWMILGLILGGVIPGILLLLAYMKFDEITRPAPQQQYAQGQTYTPPPPPPPQSAPPQPPPAETPEYPKSSPTETVENNQEDDTEEKLQKLKKMYDTGLIDDEEYKQKKQEILNKL